MKPFQMHQKRGNNMLIVCFRRKHSCSQIPLLVRKRKKTFNLCKRYELYWSEKGNLGCKTHVHKYRSWCEKERKLLICVKDMNYIGVKRVI